MAERLRFRDGWELIEHVMAPLVDDPRNRSPVYRDLVYELPPELVACALALELCSKTARSCEFHRTNMR